ncbi:MAG: hypothetical protein QOD51_1828 [Candidatus Eremiobacteraeota bacterium]|jgi:hypothetical protein|nr:hypothetical protein [Candidatus Eremiobacteraeota bacterium]
MIHLILGFGVFVVALDAIESIISRTAGVPYDRFMLLQILVYTAILFILPRRGVRLGDILRPWP